MNDMPDKDRFWKIIDAAVFGACNNSDRIAANLKMALRALSERDLLSFGAMFDGCVTQAFSWDLWGAAYVINGGCSDDGFLYFIYWLISRGKTTFEKVIQDPDSLVEVDIDGVAENEEFGSAVLEVLVERGLEAMRPSNITWPTEPAGNQWVEHDLPQKYPRLAKKYM